MKILYLVREINENLFNRPWNIFSFFIYKKKLNNIIFYTEYRINTEYIIIYKFMKDSKSKKKSKSEI